jgi:uncharacterized cofD-like protein
VNAAGPRVVALGGGHGLAITLAAVRRYARQVTAVVSVADDGGSSGRLRQSWDGPAPGDVRHCLVSLADPDSVWQKAFDYRFPAGELAGHSLGNLMLLGLTEATGSFIEAIAAAAGLLGVQARVLPATAGAVDLKAVAGGREVVGQVNVMHAAAPIRLVSLVPPDPPAPAEVLEAIEQADQVVIGPGSLYTSVLAACIVPSIRQALAARRSSRVYVCNLAAQTEETTGLDAGAHLAALADHGVPIDVVVCDPTTEVGVPVPAAGGPQVIAAPVAAANGHAHDPERLAGVLEALARRS